MSNVLNLNCQWEMSIPEMILIQSGVTKVSFNYASVTATPYTGYIHLAKVSSSASTVGSYFTLNKIDITNATKIVSNLKCSTYGSGAAYIAIFENDYRSMAGGRVVPSGTSSPVYAEYDVSRISGLYSIGVFIEHGTQSTTVDLYDLKVV